MSLLGEILFWQNASVECSLELMDKLGVHCGKPFHWPVRGGCSSVTPLVSENSSARAQIPHSSFITLAVQGMQETVGLSFVLYLLNTNVLCEKIDSDLSLAVRAVWEDCLWQTLFSLIGCSLEMLILFSSFILCAKECCGVFLFICLFSKGVNSHKVQCSFLIIQSSQSINFYCA